MIAELESLGYIRELELTRMIIRAWTHKGRGKKAIEHKLKQVGISPRDPAVSEVLDEMLGQQDPVAQIKSIIQERFSKDFEACLSQKREEKFKANARLFRKLVARGFSMSDIQTALRSMSLTNALDTGEEV